MSTAQHYHFDVVMTCAGCSNAINRVLTRLEPDVSNIEISLEKQTVDVVSVLPLETVLEKIKKTGKQVKNAQVL
ncbi:copper metallochaperone ATX1 LALA0_S11e02432g [Lachancea lanzarotensis]|uniref:LALA0S11e02432g1_1 n=1 Tax=Lachancea lanzarotensis TaxID=1245769 RepID=A0A0C7MWI5_9SACH|nr:uncharacterized protein LALA0_S11e02432g [Lachancea lanzarotensis]CEP64365.1 LALA0S11e02432g1_1 [Lachancea lanzarotensis]